MASVLHIQLADRFWSQILHRVALNLLHLYFISVLVFWIQTFQVFRCNSNFRKEWNRDLRQLMPGTNPVTCSMVGPYMDSHFTLGLAFAAWPIFLPKHVITFAFNTVLALSPSFHMHTCLWYQYGRESVDLVIAGNEYSLFSFIIQQNLASWNPSNPECLLLVVKELVQQYHQFQCSRLRESSRLMFEYQTLLEEPQYGENMEIYAGKKNNWVRMLLLKCF